MHAHMCQCVCVCARMGECIGQTCSKVVTTATAGWVRGLPWRSGRGVRGRVLQGSLHACVFVLIGRVGVCACVRCPVQLYWLC